MNKSEIISNLKFFLTQYQQWSATCNKINSLNGKLTQYTVPPKMLDKMSKKEYKRLKKQYVDEILICCFIIVCAAALLLELLKAIFPIPFAEIYKLAGNIIYGLFIAIFGLLVAAYLIIIFILAPKAAKSDRDKYNQNVERKNEKNQHEFSLHQRQIPSIQAEINCLLTVEKGQKEQKSAGSMQIIKISTPLKN